MELIRIRYPSDVVSGAQEGGKDGEREGLQNRMRKGPITFSEEGHHT